jgi:hypothetical protein
MNWHKDDYNFAGNPSGEGGRLGASLWSAMFWTWFRWIKLVETVRQRVLFDTEPQAAIEFEIRKTTPFSGIWTCWHASWTHLGGHKNLHNLSEDKLTWTPIARRPTGLSWCLPHRSSS